MTETTERLSDERLRELADKNRHFATATVVAWNAGEPVRSNEVVAMASELLALRSAGEAVASGDHFAKAAARLREMPDLRDGLRSFVDMWGIDAYHPPEQVQEAVRSAVQAFVIMSESPLFASPPSPSPVAEGVDWRDLPEVYEAKRGLNALYLEAPESVCRDLSRRIGDAFAAIAAHQGAALSGAMPAGVGVDKFADALSDSEIRIWINSCNHEPARQALRQLLAYRIRSVAAPLSPSDCFNEGVEAAAKVAEGLNDLDARTKLGIRRDIATAIRALKRQGSE